MAAVLANAISSSSFGSRVIAAAVMIPLAIGLTWVSGWPFSLLILFCAGMIAREWARLCGGAQSYIPSLALATGALLIIAGSSATGRYDIGLGGCVVLYIALGRVPIGLNTQRGREWLAAGSLAIVPAGLSLIWLRNIPGDGFDLIVWLFAVVWTTDTAAFLVGRAVGGPRLAPTISPAKTWTGSLAGLAGAAIMGFALSYAVTGELLGLAAVAGAIIGLASGAGDLCESYMKRRFNAKDSGALIPGHGGVLDRLDSLLAAAPAAACMYLLEWRWL